MDKINNFNFLLFVVLLPFCALGYFYNIFSSWAANASLYPLLIGVILISFKLLVTGKAYKDQILKHLIIFSFVALIGTFIMSIYLSNSTVFYNEDGESIYITDIKKIATFSIIFLTIYYVASSTVKLNSNRTIIRTIYISFILVIIYGYIQIFAILFPFSVWYNIYMFIQYYINFGWVGLNEQFNKIPQIYLNGGRIILTAQEPSVAGYLLTTLYYPFILSSIVSGYSVYKKRFLGVSIESIFFILSIPLIFFTFSTSLYVIFLILILFAFYLYLRKITIHKLIKVYLLFFILVITSSIIYIEIPKDYVINISQVLEKIFMSGHGKESAQTRYGFMYAGLIEFLHYPFFGVGVSNSKYVFPEYIPLWAYNSEVIYYLSIGEALGPKGFWSWLLGETGIFGTITFLLFLYSLTKKYLSCIGTVSREDIYLRYAFFLFLLSFILQGFNSAALFFIWQWTLFGLFIGFVKCNKLNKEVKKYANLH